MSFKKLGLAISAGALFSLSASAAPRADSESARYIVQVKRGTSARQLVGNAGGRIARDLAAHDAVAAYLSPKAAEALAMNPNVVLIEADQKRYLLSETKPYGISLVNADSPTLDQTKASNVSVCIIDSGYGLGHPDLPSVNVTASTDSVSGNPFNDTCGHGSHVAGTIAAIGGNDEGVIGVNSAGDINLHIVKVFGNDTDGGCDWSYSSDLVGALDECVSAGADIVSMSLGGSLKSRFEDQAFKAAQANGILSIAAAGNDGNTRMSYPASYSSVMSVAAIDSNKAIASFSQQNSQVEIAAPGVAVLSTVPWYSEASATVNGTTYDAHMFEASPSTDGTSGTLVDGGICDSSNIPGATGNIVLCQRGSITFASKVQNAETAGAAGVIMYNNVSGNFAGTLADSGVTIPAVSISLEDGQVVKANGIGTIASMIAFSDPNGYGYEAWDGTSMATPHVSGVAALVLANAPAGTTTDEVRQAMNKTAEDLGPTGRDVAFGYGLVDAAAALACLNDKANCLGSGTTDGGTTDGGTGGGKGGKGGKPKVNPINAAQ